MVAAALLGASALWAQDEAPADELTWDAADEAALEAELEALLDDLQPGAWQVLGGVSAAWGQRENPGLSTVLPESANFGEVGLEAFARRESARWDSLFMLDGRTRWYDGHPVIDDEAAWFGRGELRVRPLSWLQLGVSSQGYWQDQVLDLTETIGARTVAPLQVTGGDVGSALRLSLPWGFAIEGGGRLLRADYEGVPEDYDAQEWRGELSWTPWSWLELVGATTSTERDYDYRREATVGGRLLDDTILGLQQDGLEARVRVRFTAVGTWRMEGRWSELENRDGASGFYDYDRDRWSAELGWSFGDWRLQGRYERSDLDYLVQTVGAGLTPEARTQADRFWEIEARRTVGEHWEVFGRWEQDDSRSNEIDASYTDETVKLGVNYLF